MTQSLREAIAERPVVIDGGLATQLEAQGNDLSSALWSARLLTDAPEQIVQAHRTFFEAGARVAITASYQASFDGFAAAGLDAATAAGLIRRSVSLASEARELAEGQEPRWVAASVGPYGAALADGSEYRGDYSLSVDELRAWHRPRLEVLADAGADLLAIETIPCLAEAEAVLREVADLDIDCWLSLTCNGDLTRAGEPVDEAYAMAAEVDNVFAVGANCVEASQVAALLGIAGRVSGKPTVAYPNSGEGWDAQARTWVGRTTFSPADVDAWISSGARLIGGCCRVGPDEVTSIARAVRQRG